MTGQEMLNRTRTERRYTAGNMAEPELVQIPLFDAKQIGQIDATVLTAWTADAATITSEQRDAIVRRLRIALMAGKTGGSPNLATTAALIDMLEMTSTEAQVAALKLAETIRAAEAQVRAG